MPISEEGTGIVTPFVRIADTNGQVINVSTNNSMALYYDMFQELLHRLAIIGACRQSGAESLRVTPQAGSTVNSVAGFVVATVTTVTNVATVSNFGVGVPAKEMADDMNNMTATLANIHNVIS